MKYTVEIASCGMVYILVFFTVGSGVQNLLGVDAHADIRVYTQTAEWSHKPTVVFKNKENTLYISILYSNAQYVRRNMYRTICPFKKHDIIPALGYVEEHWYGCRIILFLLGVLCKKYNVYVEAMSFRLCVWTSIRA